MPEADRDRWQQLKDVFQAALDRPAEERGAFVDEACGGDAELRREVSSLLSAQQDMKGFLSQPALASVGPVEVEGRRIDAYRVLGELGRGGMGVVYRAVRDDSVFQKAVALKVVHGGADPEHVRRFGQERRILARLQHPNIASILDGGTTADGRPYLVMEYVEGVPIDVYCARRGLGTPERLSMFRAVCGAVHHAHQNLVLHRDLKPANILVGVDGQPKLLDFGIAKLLAAGADPDAATATLRPMMTPEYASPEQVRGEVVTTASDVYSLGVVLYEVLTDCRPFAVPTDSLAELVRTLCETEPQPPSMAAAARALPGETRRSLVAELQGDVDTIVMQCLRKDPARRYASAFDLSEDIRRHLQCLPVAARPDTARYRATKFVKRHRAAVAGAAALALSLLGGAAATLRQAHIAEANRVRAERRFADVRRLAGSLLFDVHDAIVKLPGSTRARQAIVARAQEYLEGLSGDAQSDPDLQRELAAAYQRLGDVQGGTLHGNLGDSAGALQSYQKALALRVGLARASGAAAADVEALAEVRYEMAMLYRGMADLPQAVAACQGAIDLFEELIASQRASDQTSGRLAMAYQRLGEAQARRGAALDAEIAAGKAVVHAEDSARRRPGDAEARARLAVAYYGHAERLSARKDYRAALEDVAKARSLQEALLVEQPLNTQVRRALGFTLHTEGACHQFLGEYREAVRAYEEGLASARQLVAADAADFFARLSLAVAERALGWGLALSGDRPRGLVHLHRARAAVEPAVRADPANGIARGERDAIDYYLGKALLGVDSVATRAEGCAALLRVRASWRTVRAQGHLDADETAGLAEVESLASGCGGPAG
jgi:non-specific serine/threonine protein kinase/serine/threonine-protein kinase